ncbi:MAG: hypothetical protein UEU47_06945 [Oscillospiraceae bacterium]|nr:hypothetical protein [Oscillospiraceae bacterium]
MKKILAFILTISMLCAMSACGAGTSSAPASSQPEATTAPAEETQSAPEAPSQEPTEAPSAEEPASAEDVTPEPANQIEYPLEESYTFTMTATLRNNVLQVLGDDDFSVTSAYRGLEAATGCSIDFNMLGEATAEEKTNIMLASGDMTDFYTGLGSYGNNLTGAIHDGILFDMAPMLEEYAPDYKALLDSDAELAASATNPDGTISMFVSQAADVVEKGILIRQDWLDKLGLEAPTNREALEDILHQFQSEMGASMPILMNFGLETGLSGSFNVSYAGMRSMDYQLTEPNGKEVVACFASENFIEYLVYLNHLYNDGLITDDFMSTGREYGNWESSYYSGKCGVWSDGFRELDPANRSNADDPNYMVSPIALTDYDCHVAERSTASMNGMLFLTTACEKPELAMEMINYCYTTDGRHNGLYGMEGEGYTLTDDGKVQLTENLTNNPNWSLNNALLWYGAAQWMPTCTDMEYYELIGAKESIDGIKYWTDNGGDKAMKLPAGVSLSAEANTEFNNLASDVLTLFSEGAVRVVTGALDEAGYRALIEDANGMGLARMTELYQEAYDAYLAG